MKKPNKKPTRRIITREALEQFSKAEIIELFLLQQSQLAKDSSNSSKPPSTDGLKKNSKFKTKNQ